MSDAILKKFEELVSRGEQLVPLGGFEHSGYNARLQNKYLEWRKECLQVLDMIGPIGFPAKNKMLSDSNGGHFFQSSAQLILTAVREVHEKIKVSPELVAAGGTASAGGPGGGEKQVSATPTSSGRVLRPPPKKPGAAGAPSPAATASAAGAMNVYVIGEENDALKQELSMFLREIGLGEITLNRTHGQMLKLDQIQHQAGALFAFFVFNSEDLAYAMFEVGHFVGKLGNGRVCVLHMSDVEFPKNVPGVISKPIVVKLEEASLSIIRELKACGYKISL